MLCSPLQQSARHGCAIVRRSRIALQHSWLCLIHSGEAGGVYSGAAMNPARVIGSSAVFLCTPQK